MSRPVAAQDYLSGANLYRDVAQYASFGTHRFGSDGGKATTLFHTPADDISSSGPQILEPAARAFAEAVRAISAQREGAFR
jgi:hypothetical protein